MKKELEELRNKVNHYDDLFNSKDAAFASLLLKRVFSLLQNDNHMLWKLLQENLGRDWFQKPVLHRNMNYKYHIDYEPMDSIIGDLVKMVIGNSPLDATRIASSQECLVISYMAEVLQNQRSFIMKELLKKDQFEQRLLEGRDGLHNRREEASGEDIILSSSPGVLPSHISHTMPDNGPAELAPSKESHLQGTVRMLMTELNNLRAEKMAVYSNYEVLKGEFGLFEKFVQEVSEAAGVSKEGVAITRMLGKIKKLDNLTLMKNNFTKVIAQGKTDLIAKTALVVNWFLSGLHEFEPWCLEGDQHNVVLL